MELAKGTMDLREGRTSNESSDIGKEVCEGSAKDEGIRQGPKRLDKDEGRDEQQCANNRDTSRCPLDDDERIDLLLT